MAEAITDQRQGWTSASNAMADAACPGRHLAQKGLEDSSSSSAKFGDAVHAAEAGEDVDLNVTQERVLEMASERRSKVLARFPNNTFEIIEDVEKNRLWAVQRQWKHSGLCDKIFYDAKAKLAVIEDLKSLRGLVADSPENMQLRDLAVLVWLNYAVEEVVVFINQPMVNEQQKITRYNQDTLARAWSYMKLRISNSNNPESKRVPGSPQCDFCRARGVCPEAIEWKDKNTVALLKQEESAKDLVARIPLEKLADGFRKSKTIIAIVSEIKARLLTLPDEELDKLGLRRKAGFFRETINDNKELVKRLKELGVKQSAVVDSMKMTKGELEKIVREVTEKKGKELDIAMDQLLIGIVDKAQNSDSLEILK